ncbi:MAG: GMC family oxidoreductase N-terminal domain-containing protein [Polyangiales bacterium]
MSMLTDEADYVIVGTGAGGATAARVLSAAGCSVIMLEEGPQLRSEERPRELIDSMAMAFRDFGTFTTRGTNPFPLLQGRCVGGSTAINSGIIWRLPDDVRRDWIDNFGLGDLVEEKAMDRIFGILEDELQVTENSEEILGENGRLMKLAAEKLGLPGRPIHRNAKTCKARGECLQGCPGEARQSMDVSYVPRAIKDGARLHAMCKATKIIIEGGRAVGVEGEVLERGTRRKTGKFSVRAKRAVIVAASVVWTPVLLRRSGLGGLVGDRLQLHPGSAVVARFDDPISMSFGATQAYEIPMRERGYKIESLTLPPEMLAARLPGAGRDWQKMLSELDHYAQWAVQVRMKAHGRIRPTWSGDADARFMPLDTDIKKIQDGLATICRLFFAAGAKEVYPGIGRLPSVLTDVSQVKLIEEAKVEMSDLHLMASHLFGTACAGRDAATSVVGPDLQCHDVRDL